MSNFTKEEFELSSEEDVPEPVGLGDISGSISGMLKGMMGDEEPVMTSDPPLARATPGSAGYDLSSTVKCHIPPHTTMMIDSGVKINIPNGYYAQVLSRSGVSLHNKKKSESGFTVSTNSVITLAGVIDSDYRGSIGVLLHNLGNEFFHVNVGDRIAQLVLHRIHTFNNELPTLKDAEFEHAGFGSTN